MKTDLSRYDNSWYHPGGKIKRLAWYFTNVLFFINPLNPFSGSVAFVWRKNRHRCKYQTLRKCEISMAIGSGGLFLDRRECVDRQSCQGEDWQ